MEAKWGGAGPLGTEALAQLRDHLSRYPRTVEVMNGLHVLAAAGGFTRNLVQRATEDRVILLGPDRLVGL